MSVQQPELPNGRETTSEKDEWSQHRAERRELRRSLPLNGWIGGGTLIIVGLAFLAQNFLGWDLSHHWWAIFILIPAFSALATAWAFTHSDKPHLRQAALGPLLGGSFMLMIAAALFFDISFKLAWPFFFIVIGISLIWKRGVFTTSTA